MEHYKIKKFKGRIINVATPKTKLAEYYFKSKYIKTQKSFKINNNLNTTNSTSINRAIDIINYNIIYSGKKYVLKADIKKFFTSVDTKRLKQCKLPNYFNENAIDYINSIFIDDELKVGCKFSNLFADIYIHDILTEVKYMKYCRFVDDFLFFFKTKEEAEKFLEKFKNLLEKEKLYLNDKTMINHCTSKKNNYLGLKFYFDEKSNDVKFSVNKTTQKRIEKKYREFYNIISKNYEDYEKTDQILFEMHKYTVNLRNYYRSLPINIKRDFHFSNNIILSIADMLGFLEKRNNQLINNLNFYEGNQSMILLLQ